eukprot:5026397-Prymnesium_polylepis.1
MGALPSGLCLVSWERPFPPLVCGEQQYRPCDNSKASKCAPCDAVQGTICQNTPTIRRGARRARAGRRAGGGLGAGGAPGGGT